jgi:DNA-binding LytR/AlgR family response regulator
VQLGAAQAALDAIAERGDPALLKDIVPALSTDLLAIVVAVVAFCISGIFLLLLLPDSARSAARPIMVGSADAVAEHAENAAPTTVPAPAAADGGSVEFAGAAYASVAGAAAPPRRFARHLPIERDGGTHFLAVDDVVAIHANSHYTYIFDGSDKLFCPLAIGDVESRLDNDRFIRVHRSHIVNIDRVVGTKRSGDNEMVELAGAGHYAVPVARSRVGSLRSRIATLAGADRPLAQRRRHRFASQ